MDFTCVSLKVLNHVILCIVNYSKGSREGEQEGMGKGREELGRGEERGVREQRRKEGRKERREW